MYWWGYKYQDCHFSRSEKRKARKVHTCYECEEEIPVGTSYYHFVSKSEDGFSAGDICLECDEDWKKVVRIFHDNGELEAPVIYGFIVEAVRHAINRGFLEKADPLARKWLNIPEEEDISEKEDILEKQKAVLQMRMYSRPLL